MVTASGLLSERVPTVSQSGGEGNGKIEQVAVSHLFAQNAFDIVADFCIGLISKPLQHMPGVVEDLEVVFHDFESGSCGFR